MREATESASARTFRNGGGVSMNATLEAALEFAGRGWPVLPVHTMLNDGRCSCLKPDCPWPGKHPTTRHGYKDATTNRDILKAWFSENERNIGIATGDSFCALDIDENTASAWAVASYITGGIPYTLSARTQRGYHFYFICECEGMRVPTKVLSVAPKIELVGAGKYVIVPPSQFKRWLNLTEPKPIPERILKLPAIRERRSKIATIVRGVGEGRRNVSACTMAGKLLGCFPEKDWHSAWVLLQAWNEKNGPPLSKNELKRVFSSISGRERNRRNRQTSKEAQFARALAVALEHSNLSLSQLTRLAHVSYWPLYRLLNPPYVVEQKEEIRSCFNSGFLKESFAEAN